MAQLDNAADSDSEERGFKSLWAGQNENPFSLEDGFLFCIIHFSLVIIHYSLKKNGFSMNDE